MKNIHLYINILYITSIILLGFGCKNKSEDLGILELAVGNLALQTAICNNNALKKQANRSFSTGFEAISDFDGFYLTPQNYQGAVTHNLDSGLKRSGSFSHKAIINQSATSCVGNCNHRGYPTIQLHKTSQGSFRTPVLVEYYSYLTMTIPAQKWFSSATFSTDASDNWARTVLVNLGDLNKGTGNYLHLMHVPTQGQGVRTYQTSSTVSSNPYPQNQWVKISVCLDFEPGNGSAKVYQDGVLVSSASVTDGCGTLEQAHFGMYAPASLSSGTIYNDDLTISEITACPY